MNVKDEHDQDLAAGYLCRQSAPYCACEVEARVSHPDDQDGPTDRDYIAGRARFTTVAEWATTGARLAWKAEA